MDLFFNDLLDDPDLSRLPENLIQRARQLRYNHCIPKWLH